MKILWVILFCGVRAICPNTPNITTSEQQTALLSTNSYRQCWRSAPLRYEAESQKTASEWASTLLKRISSGNGNIEHGMLRDSINRPVGQNLLVAYSAPRYRVEKAIKNWYKEYRYYNGNYSPASGHFSQMIWNSTIGFGIGIARDGTNTVIVANYRPPGNTLNLFSKNIFNLSCPSSSFCIP